MRRESYRGNRSFVNYIRKTWMNKLAAIFMVAVGSLPVFLDNGDASALAVFTMLAMPMFFAKKSWFA